MHWTTRGSSPLRAVPYAQVAGGFASFLRMAEVLGMTKTMDRRAATHKKVLYSGADTSAGLLHSVPLRNRALPGEFAGTVKGPLQAGDSSADTGNARGFGPVRAGPELSACEIVSGHHLTGSDYHG